MKKFVVVALVCALAFQGFGCTGLIVQRGKTPYETTPISVTKAEKPSSVDEKFVGEKVEIISDIPAGNYPKLKLGGTRTKKEMASNTVRKLQEEARRMNQILFVSHQPMVIETQGRNGRWYTGWTEPETVFIAEKTLYQNGIADYRLVRVGECWNPARHVTIRITPAMLIRTERYQDTALYAERYRDIDYTPAIWAFIAGGVLGYFIAPAGDVTRVYKTVNITKKGGGKVPFCPPGGVPAAR